MKPLLSAAAVASAFTAVANTVWLFYQRSGGRVRDTGFGELFTSIYLQFGIDPLHSLPDIVHRHRDLSSWSEIPVFLLLATVANIIIGLVVAQVFGLISAGAAKVGGPRLQALPKTFAVVLCLAPAVVIPAITLEQLGRQLGHWILVTLMLAGAVLILGAAFGMLWFRWDDAERFLEKRLRAVAGLLVALVIAVIAVKAGTPAKPVAPAGAPNILLISIDSLRRDHLSAYGYKHPTSPHIDKLAREGVRFHVTVSPATWTLPSHVTMLTSLPPRLHGVRDVYERFSSDVTTLAEVLADAGYATAGFVAGSFLSSTHGFAQGFDHYDDYTILNRTRQETRGPTSPTSLGLVRRWLGRRGDPDRPFFIFLHLWDVHYDYVPPPPYDTMFDPDYKGDITGELLNPRINRDLPQRDIEHLVALYDGEIRYTDEHLGKLFDLLAKRGDLDNTIVVVTADHGDEFFEHGAKGHGKSLFDEVLLVPLVIRYPPRIPAGRVVEQQVRLLDIGPTILSLAGIERPEKFGDQGAAASASRDLMPIVLGQAPNEPGLLAFGHLRRDVVSIRTETSKLMRHTSASMTRRYDLVKDPGEQLNIHGDEDPHTDTLLHELLDQWWSGDKQGPLPTELDQRQIEVLRSLGYLQ